MTWLNTDALDSAIKHLVVPHLCASAADAGDAVGIDQFEYLERDSSWELDLSSTTTGLIGIVNTQQSIGWTTKGSHWVAYVVDLPSKYQNLRVTVFDSLAPTSKATRRRIAKVAEGLAKTSATSSINPTTTSEATERDPPTLTQPSTTQTRRPCTMGTALK